MSDQSTIEWTDATWNPVTGCTEVSPGCDHCYAKTFAERWRGTPGHYFEQGFDVVLRPDKLALPFRWRKPRKVFVNSMSDLFHDAVPRHFIADVFAVMALTPQHTYQLLTKRHGRMRSLLTNGSFVEHVRACAVKRNAQFDDPAGWWPLPNVWLGVSTENQQWANVRIPALLDTPAAVRWISAEPLLGPIDLDRPRPHDCDTHRGSVCPPWYSNELDWVVAGGESGVGARPVNPQWIRDLRDQCVDAAVPFLFKQWGGRTSKSGGRELDGRTWDQYPDRTPAAS